MKSPDVLLRVILVFSLLTGSIFGKTPQNAPCSVHIQEQVQSALESAASLESDAKYRAKLLKSLTGRKSKILERIQKICPPEAPCPPETLTRAIITTVESEIAQIEALNVRLGSRVWLALMAATITCISLTAASQNYLTTGFATLAVAVLTTLTPYIVDAFGAPVMAYIVSPFRRWIFANNHLAYDRDAERHESVDRFRLLYMIQQELYSDVEIGGRTTDTENIMRILNSLIAATQGHHLPPAVRRDRAATIFGKLISHIVKNYGEVDLRERDYVEWAQAFYGNWEIPEGDRQQFVQLILSKICEEYDLDARSDLDRQKNYVRILRAWFHSEITGTQFEFAEGLGI